MLPFVLLVLLAWSISCGDAWALPIGAGVATFLVQTHVSYGCHDGDGPGRGCRRRGDHRMATAWRCASPRPRAVVARAWSQSPSACSSSLWLPVVDPAARRVTREPGHAPALLPRPRARAQLRRRMARDVVAAQPRGPTGCAGNIVRNIYSGAVDLSGPTPIAIAARCSSARRCSPGAAPRTVSGSTCSSRSRSSPGSCRSHASSARSSRTSSSGPGRSGCSPGSRSAGRWRGGGRHVRRTTHAWVGSRSPSSRPPSWWSRW